MPKVEEVKRLIAISYDGAAFKALTSTYDFPNQFRIQQERQCRAFEMADAHVRTIVSAVVKDEVLGETDQVN